MTRAADVEKLNLQRPVVHKAIGTYVSQLNSNVAFIFAVL
jgi:hypothetical protein